MSLKPPRVRDTDLEFDAAFERFLSTSRVATSSSSNGDESSTTTTTTQTVPSSVSAPDEAGSSGHALAAVPEPKSRQDGQTSTNSTVATDQINEGITHQGDVAVVQTRQQSEPLSSAIRDHNSPVSGPSRAPSLQPDVPVAGPSRAPSVQPDVSNRTEPASSGRLGSAHPALDIWARHLSLKAQQPTRPKKIVYDEHGNIIHRRPGRPKLDPSLRKVKKPILDEFGNPKPRRKPGRPPKAGPKLPGFPTAPTVDRSQVKLESSSPQIKMESETLRAQTQASEHHVAVKDERLAEPTAYLPTQHLLPERAVQPIVYLPTEDQVPNRAETHTLFAHHARRQAWVMREAARRVGQGGAQVKDDGASSGVSSVNLPWVRWTATHGYPEFAPHLVSSGKVSTAIGASITSMGPTLFPQSGHDAYRSLLKSQFTTQRTPQERLCVSRLVSVLRRTGGAPQTDRVGRKAFRQRRPTPLDARHLWTVWARKAHATQSPRKNVAFPLLEAGSSETRPKSLRVSPEPSTSDAAGHPSPTKTLRFFTPQHTDDDEDEEEGNEHVAAVEVGQSKVKRDTDRQLPFLRRNLRLYAKLGYPVDT